MKKLLFIFLLVSSQVIAQDNNADKPAKVFSKENAFVGGSATFSLFDISNGALVLGLNPMYGYYVKKWWDVAGVVNLQYNNFELDPQALLNGRQKNSFMVGVGASTRIYPIDFLYIQVQPEANIIFAKEKPISFLGGTGPVTKSTNLIPSLLVGAGYKRGFAQGRTFGWVSLLFDVLANKNSPYRNIGVLPGTTGDVIPIIRAGYNIMLSDLKNNNR